MRVLERQPLPANAGEADGDDRVAALLLDADDHPLAPARVPNARAHAKRQIVAERLAEGRVRLAHDPAARFRPRVERRQVDRKSTRLNSSHVSISYAVFCLKKKTKTYR